MPLRLPTALIAKSSLRLVLFLQYQDQTSLAEKYALEALKLLLTDKKIQHEERMFFIHFFRGIPKQRFSVGALIPFI